MNEQSRTGSFVLGDAFARILTKTTQSPVYVLDEDGRILLFDDACERAPPASSAMKCSGAMRASS
jgi:hypothetical protein